MYENLIGVAFSDAYTGVVTTAGRVAATVYAALRVPAGLHVWYFDHTDTAGAVWIASGGHHAEPVIDWLHSANQNLDCTSMLAAVLANGARIPDSEVAYTFTIPRRVLDHTLIRRLVAAHQFTMYLPYEDEFRLLVPEIQVWQAIRRSLDGLPGEWTRVAKRADVAPAPQLSRRSSSHAYDPIAAQVHEVMHQISPMVITEVGDLAECWEHIWPPVPENVSGFQIELSEEEERIQAQLQIVPSRSGARDAVLADIDRYAAILRKVRRVSADLHAQLLELQGSAPTSTSYKRVATPMMLRALQRYTADVASRLGVSGYMFVPVVGDKFAVTSRLFPDVREAKEGVTDTAPAAVVEIPAEARLRLGALPMIAREVASLMDDDLRRVFHVIEDLEHEGNPWALSVLRTGTSGHRVERRNDVTMRIGKDIAADLIATAVVGPQYVLAMARFAVGTLSQSRINGLHDEQRLAFRQRLGACLALLRELNNPAEFTSVYLSEAPTVLPVAVVNVVLQMAGRKPLPSGEELDRIAAELRAGCVVRASPVAVMATLWRAVAVRGDYMNEVAALVSIAAAG
jgi:hypothetical protein